MSTLARHGYMRPWIPMHVKPVGLCDAGLLVIVASRSKISFSNQRPHQHSAPSLSPFLTGTGWYHISSNTTPAVCLSYLDYDSSGKTDLKPCAKDNLLQTFQLVPVNGKLPTSRVLHLHPRTIVGRKLLRSLSAPLTRKYSDTLTHDFGNIMPVQAYMHAPAAWYLVLLSTRWNA